MLHLVYGLWETLFRKDELKLLVIGVDGAGKSTYVEQLKHMYAGKGMPLEKITPTIGLNIARLDILGANVLLWDLGGKPALRSMWATYFPQAHGVILVVDQWDKGRFPEVKEILKSVFSTPALARAPILIVANKADEPGRSSGEKDLQSELDLLDIALRPAARLNGENPILTSSLTGTSGIGRRFFRCVATSARTGSGVKSSIEWLVEFLIHNARTIESL